MQAVIKNAQAPVKDAKDFNSNVAPFLDLRRRYPKNLFVHEAYQDAVQQNGIEGHLKTMAEEYQSFVLQNPEELMYRYLAARSLMGRSTPVAIQQLTEIASENPAFAPAHRALAEIYASKAFHDGDKKKAKEQELAALCSGVAFENRASSLPDRSPLLAAGERLLADNGDPDRAIAMATQALRDDEWRLQRIRAFDWYTVEFKRSSERELRAEYIRSWALQVRVYRKKSRLDQAAQVLDHMEQSAQSLGRDPTDPAYWDALLALARLYAEANQQQRFNAKLEQMKQFLSQHPDPVRNSQLQELGKIMRPLHP